MKIWPEKLSRVSIAYILTGSMLHLKMGIFVVIVYAQKEKQTHYPKTANIFVNAKTSEDMIIERLTDGEIGLRCDKCRKSLFFNSENLFATAVHLGWYVSGEKHEDEHYCPNCKNIKNK